jgi:NAD(P)-dependent dehydrogenase (short-subunit alcohol dehydrogenase family)
LRDAGRGGEQSRTEQSSYAMSTHVERNGIAASDLVDRVAVVTGAASGIGRAVAEDLSVNGARIVLVDRDAERLAEVAEQLRRRAAVATIDADLADRSELRSVVGAALGAFGRVDILVNNAGVASPTDLMATDDATWDRVFAVNLFAPWRLIQLVGAHMVERGGGGKIVNVSSSSGFRAFMTQGPYGVSKAALAALTRAAAAELGPFDVNVNAVAPGPTATAMIEDRNALETVVREGPLANLLQRHSEPRDIAQTVLFLCSDASRQITGQVLHTSAGQII